MRQHGCRMTLERAGITPFGWVMNQSLVATGTKDPVLWTRAQIGIPLYRGSQNSYCRAFLVPWQPEAPRSEPLRRCSNPCAIDNTREIIERIID